MAKITIKDLLDAGVHFGHPTKRWNPKMKSFIYGSRNGIYIFDLPKTMRKLQEACQFLYTTVAEGGDVLFVATKRQAQDIVRETAEEIGMFHMVERWPGGTLTNTETIRKSIQKMIDLQEMEENGSFDKMPKKEASSKRRELGKLKRSFSGIAEMKKLPAAIFVVDIRREDIAVREANRLKIPVVAMVDTNCDPDPVDYLIPANDDALRSIKIVLEAVKVSIEAGQSVWQKVKAEEDAKIKAEKAKAEKEKAEKEEAKAKADAEKKSEKKPAEKKTEKKPAKKKTEKKADKKEEAAPVEEAKAEEKAEKKEEAAPVEEVKAEEAPAEETEKVEEAATE